MNIICLGIDPGLRNTGIGAVERFPDGSYRSRGVRVVVTEPMKGKAFSRMRSSADDQRRIREHWLKITEAIQVIQPHVIGIENYTIFEPPDIKGLREAVSAYLTTKKEQHSVAVRDLIDKQEALERALARNTSTGVGLGQAAKTIAVYGAALGAAYSAGVPVFVFEPSDRTKQIGGRRGASKEEVGAAVMARVHGLEEHMAEKVPQKTRKEHAWDGVALAILAGEEYVRQRIDLMQQVG